MLDILIAQKECIENDLDNTEITHSERVKLLSDLEHIEQELVKWQ